MQTPQTERNIIFLFELWHIEALERFFDERKDIRDEGCLLIPLDAEIESVLVTKGIQFQSGKEYRTPDAAHMLLAEEWVSSIFNDKTWSFFSYRGVSLARLYQQQLQGYINRVLYYADIVSNVVKKHPSAKRLIVFSSPLMRSERWRCLTGHMIEAPVSVIQNIATQSGLEVLVHQETVSVVARGGFSSFVLKRMIFGWGIAILNTIVVFMRRPKRIRILASDYWRNLVPSLQYLDSAEVVLTDRQEALNAGVANIWKFRMRFLHIDVFSSRISEERERAQKLFAQKWQSIKDESDLSGFLFRGFSAQPLLIKALDNIVEESSTKTLKDIDDVHALITRLKPDIVMLRATVSSQTHFSILAQVARAQGVPSIEMQHGLLYFGPGSLTRHHTAEYMGVYGPLVQREMEVAGDNQSIPLVIGSPRFDVYARVKKNESVKGITNGEKITFLCIAPMVALEEATDSYDVVEYFQAIASAMQKIPNSHIVIKLRPGPSRDPFIVATIASLFDGISYNIVQFEPLTDLFQQADVVISGYSTAALEALQCGKPFVYVGLCPLERMTGLHHFPQYVKEGAMRLASSEEELSRILSELANSSDARKSLSENASSFLAREYAFDGKASRRAAEFITSIASKGTL